MIYDESLVKLSKGKMKPSDMALMFACVDSDFTGLCDSIFGEDDVASKMVFNIVLNFIDDTPEFDFLDMKKIVTMPREYWDKWDNLMKKKLDIPTTTELEFLFSEGDFNDG